MIEARIIADSINPVGDRLTTFVVTYHRYVHNEVLTHRAFSRNAASSRAIPVATMLKRVFDTPAEPIVWGVNQKGMQADSVLEAEKVSEAQRIWHDAMFAASKNVYRLLELGVHKQIANRLLEPFAHMTTIISATEWGNFFNLRAHKDAQPEFQELAFQMLAAYRDSIPVMKKPNQWHLPFADQYLSEGLTTEQLLKIATARCARVSYLNFEGDIDHEKDYQLHDQLLSSGHMSPFEHCAKSMDYPCRKGNFIGWTQYRKTIPNENRDAFDSEKLIAERVNYAAA